MKTTDNREIEVERLLDTVDVRVNGRRVMVLPLGSAAEFAVAVYHQNDGPVCCTDDARDVEVSFEDDGEILVQVGGRKVLRASASNVTALRKAITKAAGKTEKDLGEPPPPPVDPPKQEDKAPKRRASSKTPKREAELLDGQLTIFERLGDKVEVPAAMTAEDRKRATWSHSRLNDYTECGERYRRKRIDKEVECPSWALIGGRAIHQSIEAFETTVVLGDQWPDEDFMARTFQSRLIQEVTAAMERSVGGEYADPSTWMAADKGKEDLSWWMDKGTSMARLYAYRNPPGRRYRTMKMPDGKWGMEVHFIHTWPNGVRTQGYIDNISIDDDDVVDIVDYKAGKTRPGGIQIIEYLHVVRSILGSDTTIRGGTYYDLRNGQYSRVYTEDELSPEDIGEVYRQAQMAELNGVYLPNVGLHCKRCSFQKDCQFGRLSPGW